MACVNGAGSLISERAVRSRNGTFQHRLTPTASDLGSAQERDRKDDVLPAIATGVRLIRGIRVKISVLALLLRRPVTGRVRVATVARVLRRSVSAAPRPLTGVGRHAIAGELNRQIIGRAACVGAVVLIP